MSSEENQLKALHGVQARLTLDYIVAELENYGAFETHKDSPTYGYDNHDKSQFKADKEITASDGTEYILYSTNSIRSDRVKGQQWDAYNIKQIDGRIEYAYIIIPDDDALKGGKAFRDKMRSGSMFSAIDDILTVEEFYEAEIAKYGERLKSGVRHDLEGRKFEELFCSILGSHENLNRFNGVGIDIGYLYDTFYKVMRALGFEPGEIESIYATTDIPKLPSGGNPKTDVAAVINLQDGGKITTTFSLKDTSNTYVSVHQYSADDFADVLDPNNDQLRALLNEFQSAGCAKDMKPGTADKLRKELKPYLLDLDRWVFSGRGAVGVRSIQCAQYLVTKAKGTTNVEVHNIDSYCYAQEKLNKGTSGFGTVFQWTYASGQRGKSIQLKAKIIP